MAEHNNHINFSLADIERYLQGRMLPKEMHDLEKAALQDPFLADAIEGYSQAASDISNRHLNEIAAALQSKQEDSKVVPIAQKSKVQWWKIAAMIIVIAGAGTASWLLLKQQDTPSNIAQTKTSVNPAVVPPPATLQVKADTVTAVLAEANKPITPKAKRISKDLPLPAQAPTLMQASVDSAYATALAAQKEASAMRSMAAPAPAIAKAENQNIAADSFTQQNTDVVANKNVVIAQGETKARVLNNNGYAESNNTFKKKTFATGSINGTALPQPKSFQLKGRVLNDNAQPVPSALVKLNNGKTATFTDEQGFFTLYSPDSISHVTVSSAGYVARESNLRKGNPNTIALKEDDKSLAEVVVTELMSRKQATANITDTTAKGKGPYPEKGWPSFQEYVYTKLHKEQEYDSTYTGTVTGRSVELEFMVDANGIPYNIKVVHSVDEVSDKKAIDIVKQGPRWIAGDKKNKKAKVTIKL